MNNIKVTDEWLKAYMPLVDEALIKSIECGVNNQYGFSVKFRKKMRKLIEKEKRMFFWFQIRSIGRKVAVFVVVALLSMLTVTMSVEAFRTKFIDTVKSIWENSYVSYIFNSEKTDPVIEEPVEEIFKSEEIEPEEIVEVVVEEEEVFVEELESNDLKKEEIIVETPIVEEVKPEEITKPEVPAEKPETSDTEVSEQMPWIYEENKDDGTLTISAHEMGKELTGVVEIPEEIHGKKVVAIDDEAFMNCEKIESLVIPESVTKIGKSAFESCSALKGINIPKGVEVIEEHTFYGCSELSNVELPEGLREISNYAFAYCEKLEIIELPDNIEKIGDGCFSDCEQLIVAELPENLTELGAAAFRRNNSMEKIGIPKGITTINSETFFECSNLKEVILPEELLSIAEYAFGKCWKLYEIEIPKTVINIENYAFFCAELDKIRFLGNAPQIQNEAFDGVYSDAYYFREDVSWNEDTMQSYGGFLTWISMPGGSANEQQMWKYNEKEDGTLTLVAYSGEELLTTLIVPEEIDGKQVTSIGICAFAHMESLTEVKLSNQIKNIGDGAFFGCGNLQNIVIPEGVTSIGESAFEGCSSLKKVIFEGSAPWIEYSFYDVQAEMYYPADDPTWTEEVITALQAENENLTWIPYERDVSETVPTDSEQEQIVTE